MITYLFYNFGKADQSVWTVGHKSYFYNVVTFCLIFHLCFICNFFCNTQPRPLSTNNTNTIIITAQPLLSTTIITTTTKDHRRKSSSMYEVFHWNDEPPKRFSLSIVSSEINIDGPPSSTLTATAANVIINKNSNTNNSRNSSTEHHHKQYSNHNFYTTSSATASATTSTISKGERMRSPTYYDNCILSF